MQIRFVGLEYLLRLPRQLDRTVAQVDRLPANRMDHVKVVGDEDDAGPPVKELLDPTQAFLSECSITDCQDLINQPTVRIDAGCNSKSRAGRSLPDEYRFTGVSMNRLSSENSTISSKRFSISDHWKPRMVPFRKIFSRPVNSGWNPAPSSIRADNLHSVESHRYSAW